MNVGRRLAVALAVIAAGCSGSGPGVGPQPSAGPSTFASMSAAVPTGPIGTAVAEAAELRERSAAGSGAGIALLRSSEDYAPSGDEFFDFRVWRVAEAADLRVPAQDGDAAGPLHAQVGIDPRLEAVLGRAFDMCDERQAYEAIMHVPFQTGGLLRLQDYNRLQDMRPQMGCDGPPPDPGAPMHRYGYVSVHGDLGYAETAREAREESTLSVQAEAERWKDTLYGGADALGTFAFNYSGYRQIRFAPAEDPADEVRVLHESVKVRDGVLRGMVRNWSRNLFAYGTSVTVDGRSWLWPLSIQPGETAPFEIEGWDGPAEPDQIEFAVTAEMSPEIDISRAWFIDYPYQARRHTAESLRQFGYTDAVIEHVPATGDFVFYPMPIEFVLEPFSRGGQLVRNSLSDYWGAMRIGDLRAYAADLDDQNGRVLEVESLPVFAEELRIDISLDGEASTHWTLVSGYPHTATVDANGRTRSKARLPLL